MVLLRRLALPVACFAVAGVVGLGAIADHRWKTVRMDRAEVAEWYCAHRGERCGGRSSARIEARWQTRQKGYEAVVVVLGSFAIGLGVWRVGRDRGVGRRRRELGA